MASPVEESVIAWSPQIPGVAEVLHAHFTTHAYPMHVHDVWTLLIVDEGNIRFDLERQERLAGSSSVTLLPPGVPHNGAPATGSGFRKRVVYLDDNVLPQRMIGSAVTTPVIDDFGLTRRIRALHTSMTRPAACFVAEENLALITARLHWHHGDQIPPAGSRGSTLAAQFRDILDSIDIDQQPGLADAAAQLHAHPAHLIRMFSREFGIPPHQYVISRRISAARHMLLAGMPSRDVAVAAGFFDQPHFTRSFKRIVGTTPAAFARRR